MEYAFRFMWFLTITKCFFSKLYFNVVGGIFQIQFYLSTHFSAGNMPLTLIGTYPTMKCYFVYYGEHVSKQYNHFCFEENSLQIISTLTLRIQSVPLQFHDINIRNYSQSFQFQTWLLSLIIWKLLLYGYSSLIIWSFLPCH